MDPFEKLVIQFSSVLGKVLKSTLGTWQDRADVVRDICEKKGVDLDEFLSWYDE